MKVAHRCVVLMAAVAIGCSPGTTVGTDAGAHDTGVCFPACRPGFLCASGRCISACNPPCASNETCTADLRCIPNGVDAGGDVPSDTTATDVIETGLDAPSDVVDAADTGVDIAPVDTGPPCPGGPTELDLHLATIYSNPPDLADWPITTTLTEVDFTSDGVHLGFSKQDGADRWPDVTPPGWMGPLQYTLGMAECIDGHWYASAVIEFWYGLNASGGNIALDNQVAMNWYYDMIRWGRLAGRQPATGETIGIFVAAGNLRNITSDDPAQSPVMERSNVVLVPMPDVSGAMHSF